MGEEWPHKDSFDLDLNPAASSSAAVQWMKFPTSSHTEFWWRNSSDGSYVTPIRSSAFRQNSCTESQPHLGCLLWNLEALQKWFPRLPFFPRLEVKIAGRSLVRREGYRSCGKLSAVFWLNSNFMPLCDASSFGSQVLHSHVLVLLLCEIPTRWLSIWQMGWSLISAGVLSGQASPANQDP